MKDFVMNKHFIVGVLVGIVLVKFVAPRAGAIPVVGPVLSKVA